MSPIYTGDKLGFGVAPSTEGGGGAHIYNNAGMVFTNAGAYGNAGPTLAMAEDEYRDQKFWTDNHYHFYTDPSTTYTDGGFISGVELVKYDKKEKKIYWRIVGTSKKTQYFKILKGSTVEHFNGVDTKKIKKF